ncbi:MAG: cytochrome c oxidase subunit 3 [Deltaproteobacteria bacterium]|nr:cytochrome c oxidase subunit 3 [Deltaproteobacteria bacterium]
MSAELATAAGHDASHVDHGDHGHLSAENNFLGLPNIKLAMWAFLGSECMFFGSLIGTYFFYHGKSLAGKLPTEVFSITITSISTFLLLMSSMTMALAVDATRLKRLSSARAYILATAALGATFVGFQVYEFSEFVHEGLTLSTSLFGSTFFVMTGFHGAHVTVGVIWLTMLSIMISNGKLNKERSPITVESAGLYWHFVDIVWIVIFTFVYLLEFIK